MDPSDLPKAYKRVLFKDYLPYKSNTARFMKDLADYIDSVGGGR